MTDLSRSIAVKPIIKYPREAQVGKTYLITIDLQPEEGFEWQYEEEEYPIYCTVDTELFSSKPVGEPVIVLHRFGGSYGEARFLLEVIQHTSEGEITVVLINQWGVSVKSIKLTCRLLLKKEDEILSRSASNTSELAREILKSNSWDRIRELVEQSESPDEFLRDAKRTIDQHLCDKELQKYLQNADENALKIQSSVVCQPALRAFYFSINNEVTYEDIGWIKVFDPTFKANLDKHRELRDSLSRLLLRERTPSNSLIQKYISSEFSHLDLDRAFSLSVFHTTWVSYLGWILKICLIHPEWKETILPHLPSSILRMETVRSEASDDNGISFREELAFVISELKPQQAFWKNRMRDLMIRCRNIGFNEHLTLKQKQKLESYYKANLFLIKLVGTAKTISIDTQTEIKNTLLLPWEKLT